MPSVFEVEICVNRENKHASQTKPKEAMWAELNGYLNRRMPTSNCPMGLIYCRKPTVE
jgi:hypothetical protein